MRRRRRHSVRLSVIVSTDSGKNSCKDGKPSLLRACITSDFFSKLCKECEDFLEGQGQVHNDNGTRIGTDTDTRSNIETHSFAEEKKQSEPAHSFAAN